MILMFKAKEMFLKWFYDNTIQTFSWQSKFCSNCSSWSWMSLRWMCRISFYIYSMKLNKGHFSSKPVFIHIEIFYFASNENDVRPEYDQWKLCNSLSFQLFKFTLVITMRNFDFKCHWKTLKSFDKKYKPTDFMLLKNVWVLFGFVFETL